MAQLLRLTAVAASLIVLFGFAAFAAEEADKGSKGQVAKLGEELNTPAPSAQTEQVREKRHGPVRETIDDANDVLLSPFTGLVDSKDVWVTRGIPTLLALLAYGVGLTLLANYLPKPKAHGGDWRTAT